MKAATDKKMVLSFGMPRSGTTWVGKLLDSHSDTYYLHEPDTVFPRNDLPLLTSDTDMEELKAETTQWLNEILEQQHHKVTAFPPIFPKSYMSFGQRSLLKLTTIGSRLDGKLGSPLGIKPVRRLDHSQESLLVWKSIESMGRIGLIMNICPNAKAIHLLRHPCGHVNSTLQGFENKKFSTEAPIFEDWGLFEKLLKESGDPTFDLADIKAMQPEERLALRWGILNDHCMNSLAGREHKVLRYEDVCEDPLEQISGIFSWLGLEVGDQTREFIRQSTSEDKDSYYGTTKNPMKSAYSWKSRLSAEQQARIRAIVSRFKSGEYYGDESYE